MRLVKWVGLVRDGTGSTGNKEITFDEYLIDLICEAT